MFYHENEIEGNMEERKYGGEGGTLDYAGINLEAIKLNVTPI